MTGKRSVGLAAALVAIGITVTLAPGLSAEEPKAKRPTVKIALVSSLFRDIPQALITASMGPFKILMEAQTGLRGDLIQGGDAIALGGQLKSDKVQLGVFQGFEFAWAQKKFPDLKPLMIAVNQRSHLYVYVVVSKNSTATSLADLKGKSLALPARTKGHCYLYMERTLKTPSQDFAKFFGAVTRPATTEEALDDVVDGVVEATVVDEVGLECYARRKPARAARLRNLEKSCVFPAAVVAYHAGSVDDATLKKFQTGMQNANKSAFGRQLLTLWQITGFDNIPEDFQQNLLDIGRAYPAPDDVDLKK
jgi:ABC-type phosphate/phosphonate transport system substrate-binding protein